MANIVFLGNFEVPYSSENHHAKSLESLGHTVQKLQEKKATSEQVLDQSLKSDFNAFINISELPAFFSCNFSTVCPRDSRDLA